MLLESWGYIAAIGWLEQQLVELMFEHLLAIGLIECGNFGINIICFHICCHI
jgi:hypothetical protein